MYSVQNHLLPLCLILLHHHQKITSASSSSDISCSISYFYPSCILLWFIFLLSCSSKWNFLGRTLLPRSSSQDSLPAVQSPDEQFRKSPLENFFILFFKLATYFCIAFFQKDIIINYNIILHIRQCGIPDFFNSQIFVIHKGEYYLWKQNRSFMEVTPLLSPHFIMYRWTRSSGFWSQCQPTWIIQKPEKRSCCTSGSSQ